MYKYTIILLPLSSVGEAIVKVVPETVYSVVGVSTTPLTITKIVLIVNPLLIVKLFVVPFAVKVSVTML